MALIERSRSERIVTGSVRGGLSFNIENLEPFLAGIGRGVDELPDILRQILRNDAGEILRDDAKDRINSISGGMSKSIKIGYGLDGSVWVGAANQAHGTSSLSTGKLGELLESGAPPHTIRAKRGGMLSLGGRVRKRVAHPGFRAQKIMGRTIRSKATEVELVLVREIWRLAAEMGFNDNA